MKIRQAKPLKLKLGIFYFFVNRDVDGLRLKYCVNFYENQASQTSKIKIRGFSIFLASGSSQGS